MEMNLNIRQLADIEGHYKKKKQPYETTVLFIVKTLLRMLINTVLL